MIKEFSFRSNSFKVECNENYDQHPSWYTFIDVSVVETKHIYVVQPDL